MDWYPAYVNAVRASIHAAYQTAGELRNAQAKLKEVYKDDQARRVVIADMEARAVDWQSFAKHLEDQLP